MKPNNTIVHVIPNLALGGAQVFLYDLIRRLPEWRHEVYCLDNTVDSLWTDIPYKIATLWDIARVLRAGELVHFHWFPPFSLNLDLFKNSRTLVTIQENLPCTITGAKVYVVSTSSGQVFSPAKDCFVIPPAVDPLKFFCKETKRQPGLLIRHSSLYPSKISHDDIDDMLLYDPELRWRVIGKGDATYVAELKARVGSNTRVTIGESTDINGELQHAWLYVYHAPNLFEHFGLCIAEALAAGLPVVTNDQVGARMQIADKITGYICNDRATMRQMVNYLWTHPGEYERLAANVRNLNFRAKESEFLASYRTLYAEI